MAGLRPPNAISWSNVFRGLHRFRRSHILLIEHVMRAVMALAQHIGVCSIAARSSARGTPDEVVKNPAVLQCYLGEDTEL